MLNKQEIFYRAMMIFATSLILAAFYLAATLKPDERDFIARADSTQAARPIGRAEFVKVDSFDIAGEWLDASRDTLTNFNILPIGKNVFWVFTDCVPRVGEQAYLAKVNDSVFVTVWLNLDSIKYREHYLTRVK